LQGDGTSIEQACFVSELTVYRLLKAQGLITCPANILIHINIQHKQHLSSDNSSCYLSGELADYFKDKDMMQACGRSYHPQSKVKIDAAKNQTLLEY